MINIKSGKSTSLGGCDACKKYWNSGRAPKEHEVVEIVLEGTYGLTVRFCLDCTKELKEKLRQF